MVCIVLTYSESSWISLYQCLISSCIDPSSVNCFTCGQLWINCDSISKIKLGVFRKRTIYFFLTRTPNSSKAMNVCVLLNGNYKFPSHPSWTLLESPKRRIKFSVLLGLTTKSGRVGTCSPRLCLTWVQSQVGYKSDSDDHYNGSTVLLDPQ